MGVIMFYNNIVDPTNKLFHSLGFPFFNWLENDINLEIQAEVLIISTFLIYCILIWRSAQTIRSKLNPIAYIPAVVYSLITVAILAS